jgi:leucyl aminopeptidase
MPVVAGSSFLPMSFEIRAQADLSLPTDVRGIGVFSDEWAEIEAFVDPSALRALGFEAKAGQVQLITVDGRPVAALGLGDRNQASADHYRRAAAQFVKVAVKHETAALDLDGNYGAVAEGLVLGAYKYSKYKSKPVEAKLTHVDVIGADAGELRRGEIVGRAVALARDLINEPAADLTPARLGEIALEVGTDNGLRVEVWDQDRIVAEKLGGLLGVARGSDQPPRLIQLFYEPEGATRTLALVGKGITFDSGGLSIKPADSMMTMKTDMSGAAAVIATMSVLSKLTPSTRVIGIAAVSENLLGPRATKPGDVLQARNGTTMEVLNTDAEGRLVLADALSLAVEADVDAIVDIATLTGACKIALGPEIGGLFGNNDDFSDQVLAAASQAGENLWPLPLHESYRKLIDSDIADIKNIGPGGPGATTAALFLREFVGDKPWVHLDIAGPARADGDDAYVSKGGTGFGVRTLIELVCS